MASRAIQWVLVIAAIGIGSVDATRVRAEGGDPAALAAALRDTTATLQGGLKASEREGTPISAKFEIGNGKLQLSVYTMKGDTYNEVVADPKTGAITEAEEIKDADDLKAAAAQKAAMAKARPGEPAIRAASPNCRSWNHMSSSLKCEAGKPGAPRQSSFSVTFLNVVP